MDTDVNGNVNINRTENYGIIVVIICIISIIAVLFNNVSKPLEFNGCVTNTYLYIVLAILICTLTVLLIDKFKLMMTYTSTYKYLALFAVTVIVLFMVMATNNVVLQHILWLIFVILLGALFYPSFELSKNMGNLLKVVLTVIIIVLGLSYFSSKVPESYFDSWGTYLCVGLIGLIIFQFIDLIFGDKKSFQFYNRQKIYSGIAILLFSGFILYDTKKIYQTANYVIKSCPDIKNHLSCAKYPARSLSLFLDIMNLFANLSNLYQ